MKKLLFILSTVIALTSCTGVGDASVESTLVVEQVKLNEKNTNCSTCLQNNYSYRIKLKSHTGSVYYYTNYKHEIGDTLVSVFEFKDNREKIIKNKELDIKNIKLKVDSTIEVNTNLQKKNDELSLYNELLMGIIQDNAKK